MKTALLVLLLLALCGFIAYTGDLLGRRLGKRRLSLFNLRPKHTAILLTIVTGVLIAGLTFTAALAVLPGFREMVTQGERLAQRNRTLTAANVRLEDVNAGRAAESRRLEADIRSLSSTNRRLEGEKGRLTQANERLGKGNEALKAQSRGLEGTNRRLSREVRSLNEQRRELGTTVGRLRMDAADYRRIANQYRAEQYLFRRDEQISHLAVPPDPPLAVLRTIVDTLLYQTRAEAMHRRVFPPDPRSDGANHRRAIHLVKPRGYPPGRAVDARSVVEWVVGRVHALRLRPIVIRTVAEENSIPGRPVPVSLDWYENELVYRRGQVITSSSLDGEAPDWMVFRDLVVFLQVRVRTAATQASMVPTEEGLGEASHALLFDAVKQIRELNAPVIVTAVARRDTLRSGPLNLDLEVRPDPGIRLRR